MPYTYGMTTNTLHTKEQRIRQHLTEALIGQLEDGEVIEAAATQGNMFLPVMLPFLRFLRLVPPAYLVVTNKRLLLVTLDGVLPAKPGRPVSPGAVVEQRGRRSGENFRFPSSARQLQEPALSVGRINIRVEETIFQPALGWHFAA